MSKFKQHKTDTFKTITSSIGIVQVLADEWKIQTHEDLIKYRAECVQSQGITEEQVTKYKAWTFPDDEKTHKYIKCVFGKMGLFNEATGFNVEHLVQQLGQGRDATETRTEVTKCATESKDPKAVNAAWKGLTCFRAAHLDLIQLSVKKV